MNSHRHYVGCGHVFRSGIWIYDDGGSLHGDTVVVSTGHVHNDRCGHFQYRGGWYMSNGHHHGAGCGHVYRNNVWVFVDDDDKPGVRNGHVADYRKPDEVHERNEVRKAEHKAAVEEKSDTTETAAEKDEAK